MEVEALKEAAIAAQEAEELARDTLRAAEVMRQNAVAAYNEALLTRAGVVIGETICEDVMPYSWSRNNVRAVVSAASKERIGAAVVRQVTSKNRIWSNRHGFSVKIDTLKPTAETVRKDAD